MRMKGGPNGPIGVVIVAADPAVRAALVQLISRESGFCLLGAHRGGAEALRDLSRLKPKVVVLGLGQGHDGASDALGAATSAATSAAETLKVGVEQIGVCKAVTPKSLVLVLTPCGEGAQVWRCLGARADGCCVHRDGLANIPTAITALAQQGWYLSPGAGAALGALARRSPGPGGAVAALTPLEQEVMAGLVTRREKEIAVALALSFSTVHGHVKSIYRKWNVHSRAQAVRLFLGRT